MNKKLIAITTGVLMGGTMLATTVLASTNASSGYEVYKNALLNMRNVKSMTDTVKISASDNGTSLLSADLTMKVNKDLKDMSGNIAIKTKEGERSKAVYRQNNETIIKDSSSDVYNIVQFRDGQVNRSGVKPDEKMIEKRIQNLEGIIDSLIGNRKSYFALTDNSDGTKDINVKLSEDKISPVANAIASAIVRGREDISTKEADAKDKIELGLPKLDRNIRLTNVDLTAFISKDGVLEGQKGTLTLEGTDISGENHTITLNVDMSISNLNNTTTDTVNLDGKEVKTITPAELKHNR